MSDRPKKCEVPNTPMDETYHSMQKFWGEVKHAQGWNEACDAWETWEKEQPGEWIDCGHERCEKWVCDKCGTQTWGVIKCDQSGKNCHWLPEDICPGCKRKMV